MTTKRLARWNCRLGNRVIEAVHPHTLLSFTRVWMALFCAIALGGFATETNRGLSAGPHGELRLNGKAFRGIGVNYYDAFARLLDDG